MDKTNKERKNMKKIIMSSLLLLCSACLFTACDDDRDSNPTLLQPTSFTLNSPSYAASLVDLATTSSLPLTWSQPDYGGFPVAATYIAQISLNGSFTKSYAEELADESGETVCDYVELSNTFNSCKGSIDKEALAKAIVNIAKWEADEDVPASQDVYIRLVSEYSQLAPIYSNVIKLTVVPIFVEAKVYPEFIYEIGNESEWKIVHPLRSPNLDGIYQGYYWLNGEFKFRPNENDWTGDWEYAGEKGVFADNGGANFPAVEAGFYQIDADMTGDKYTYKVTKVNTISIIGTVNGNWDTDTDMTYNPETGAWEVRTTLTDGAMKFRVNHDWAVSWGGANGDPDAYDNLTQDNGKDLNVKAGAYIVQLFISYEGNNRVVLK